jgi:hypothetical protein
MYLFPYVAYLDTIKSDISVAASTWQTVTSRHRRINLLLLIVSSTGYIINITMLNEVSHTEIAKSAFLLFASALSLMYTWYAWYYKRQRARDFAIHKAHLRDLADVTIESTDVTADEAEDAFIQFYVTT